MRYAVLSDIHANLEALTAVIGSLAGQQIDRYLCLGDVVGYGADPVACLTHLTKLDSLVVAGNHDQACVGRLDLSWFNDQARTALVWTRDQLGIMDLDVLRRWPLTADEDLFTLVHSSLRQPERFIYLFDAGQMMDTLIRCRTLFCLVGHTHLPCFIEYDRKHHQLLRVLTGPRAVSPVAFTQDSDLRYLVNPGSVGQPRDGNPQASVAVIDTTALSVTFHRVSYDVAACQQKIRKAGLPAFFADRLSLGR